MTKVTSRTAKGPRFEPDVVNRSQLAGEEYGLTLPSRVQRLEIESLYLHVDGVIPLLSLPSLFSKISTSVLYAMLLTLFSLSLLAINLDFIQCMTIRRDGASIVAALKKISDQLVAMNNTLNSFQGGFDGTLLALKIQSEAMDLDADIRASTSIITQSAALNDADSATVAFIIVSLSSNIYDVLDNIVAKKPAFDSAILGIGSASFFVKSDLQHLKNDTDVLGEALTSKFVPSVAQVAPLVISDIDFHFDRALIVYA